MPRPARDGITVLGFRNKFSELDTTQVRPAWLRVFPEPDVAGMRDNNTDFMNIISADETSESNRWHTFSAVVEASLQIVGFTSIIGAT
jgi:hypothetical protein